MYLSVETLYGTALFPGECSLCFFPSQHNAVSLATDCTISGFNVIVELIAAVVNRGY